MTADLQETLTRSTELTQSGRHDEHLELMRDALAHHRDEPEVVIRAAEAHLVTEPEEAAHLATEAVELAPEDPGTLTRAAFVMFHVDRLDDTQKLFSRATAAADDDFALAFDLAHLGGQLVLARGDEAQALELFELAFENQPETATYGLTLANLLAQRGEHERALQVTEEALRHRPGDQLLEDMRLRLRIAIHGMDAVPPGATFEPTDESDERDGR